MFEIYIKLFIYILSAFIGLMNVAVLFIVSKYKNSGNKILYTATRNFTLSALLMTIIYFSWLFMRFIYIGLDSTPLLRILDILGFLGVKYFWLRIIVDIIGENTERRKKVINIIFLIFTTLAIYNFGFLMDTQYYVANEKLRPYVITVNLLMSAVPLILNTTILIMDYKDILQRIDRTFVLTNSLLIHMNACWNGAMAIGLYTGNLFLSSWITPISDPTSFFLLLININTFLFVFKRDFSPLYKLSADIKGHNESQNLTEEQLLDILIHKHLLTEREREVAILVYKGYTNPDIAEALFISRNTVRNHISNIFEKFHISSRIELIHLVHSQR